MVSVIGAVFTDLLALLPADNIMVTDQKLVLLVGKGTGPRVAFRAKYVVVRIRGLAPEGYLSLSIDDVEYTFQENGDHSILGGEFAKAIHHGSTSVICELILKRKPDALHSAIS